MQDVIYGLLLNVEIVDEDLVLRIDLTGETANFDLSHPVLQLHLLGCSQMSTAYERLSTSVGHPIEIVPQLQEYKRINVFLDYEEDVPDIELRYEDSVMKHVLYTVADLTAKLKWHDLHYQRQFRKDKEHIKRLLSILEAVRNELRQEIDRAERKITFFVDKGKAERYEIERQSYEKILSVLEYRERQQKD